MAHASNPKLLYCRVTRSELNRIPSQVDAHVKGRRFRLRKQELDEAAATAGAKPAPDEDEMDEETPSWVC